MTVSKHSALGAASEFTDAGTDADSTTTTQQRLDATRDPYVNDFTSSKFTVTIADDDPKPKFRFSSRDIQLAKQNVQRVTASVGVGAGGASPVPGEDDSSGEDSIGGTLKSLDDAGSHDVLLSVGPPDAVGRLINIRDSDSNVIHPDAMGRYVVGQISGAVPATGSDGIVFEIEARAASGFRDEQVTLMLMDGRTAEQAEADGGGIDDADPATVTVLSGEETPIVTFSDDSISIDEGESKSVHLLASSMQGDEVGTVTVAVRGEALISLEQNGSAISGGAVSFGGNANAELTIVSLSDPELETDDERTATITITDANDADIGDPSTVTVTVVGSTAVPVLPLVGQLILAFADGRRRAVLSAAPGLSADARSREGGSGAVARVPLFLSRQVMAFPVPGSFIGKAPSSTSEASRAMYLPCASGSVWDRYSGGRHAGRQRTGSNGADPRLSLSEMGDRIR